MNRIKCFFVTPSTLVFRFYRRYENGHCPGPYSYHNASVKRDEIKVSIPADGYEKDRRMTSTAPAANQKAKFPVKCDYCNFLFTTGSEFQLNADRMYFSEEKQAHYSLRDLPPGAMYYADWMLLNRKSNLFRGPDGHCLIAITPDGHPWMIDNRASNCTMPDDNEHKCWVRHGHPPLITVDKNGKTCAAGAGSIQTSKWHGFLRNGYFEE